MIPQFTCETGWIHRPFSRKKTEIQCPLCGMKTVVFAGEDHVIVEQEHKRTCRVVNLRPTPAEESRYG